MTDPSVTYEHRRGDPSYPAGLERLKNPPPVLYVRGESFALRRPGVAVVGTRELSSAGRAAAYALGEALPHAGYAVVSGLAKGIDGQAHRGALAAGGYTAAVLAHGLHTIYPAEHAMLAGEILAENGCLVSEHPDGVALTKGQLVERNRIIAGLSGALVLVESQPDGGAMHAARFAKQAGVPLFAVVSKHPAFCRAGAVEAARKLGATPVRSTGELLHCLSQHVPIEPR
jgi:DNA processing protein